MAISSVETMKTIDEKERCDPSCVVMRWSNSRSVIKIFAKANSKFDLEIKEALHINWRKPNLNA